LLAQPNNSYIKQHVGATAQVLQSTELVLMPVLLTITDSQIKNADYAALNVKLATTEHLA
jgi:hypothetical protein